MKSGQNREPESSGKGKPKYHILLAAGLFSIILGLVLFFVSFDRFSEKLFFIRPALVLLAGCYLLYRGLTVIKRSWAIFLGLYLSLCGIVFLFIDSGVSPFSLRQLWPSVVVLCGLALVPTGFYRYKRLHPSFAVPAVVLVGMGCFFLLFSLDIIQESFTAFATRWWPLLLVAAGGAMIGLFLFGQANRAVLFRDESDEDEEMY